MTSLASTRMRRRAILAVTLALLGLALVLLLSRRDSPAGDTESGRGPAPTGGMAGMDTGGDGSVRLTADQLHQFGVTFGTVEAGTLAPAVRAPGIVAFDETRLVQVTPKVGGYVEQLFVDFTGQPVRVGEALYALYSPELVAAQEELLLAARLGQGKRPFAVPGIPSGDVDLLKAARQRLRRWDVSEAQIDEILRRGEVQRTVTFSSPVAGVVIQKAVQRGQAVEAGRTLYTIADLSEVWIEAELREADAGLAVEGARASVDLSAFPGRSIEGRVEYVDPTVQPEARTLKARIAIRNPGGRSKPGMYVTVRLTGSERRALTVPNEAVVRTGERAVVFVDLGGGRLRPQEVEAGRVAGGRTEVLAGLEPGQRVVTSAQYLLESESNLGEVMSAMIGQIGTADMGGMDMGDTTAGMSGMKE
jgi:membrane fusion protein, copper/silver efflux system